MTNQRVRIIRVRKMNARKDVERVFCLRFVSRWMSQNISECCQKLQQKNEYESMTMTMTTSISAKKWWRETGIHWYKATQMSEGNFSRPRAA